MNTKQTTGHVVVIENSCNGDPRGCDGERFGGCRFHRTGRYAEGITPLSPDIAALLTGKPAVEAARIAKANRRARGADTFASELSASEFIHSEKVRASILSHRPDPAYMEDLWEEIVAALGTEAGMRLTLSELVQQAADKRARLSPETID